MRKTILIISVLVFFLPNLIFSQTNTDGIVGYWSFNGNSNDAISSNNGIVGEAVLASDKNGTANLAYSFDGINDNIRIADNYVLDMGTHDMSFSFWVNANSDQPFTWPGFIQHGAGSETNMGYWLRIQKSTGTACYAISNGTTRIYGNSSTSICDNQWHHVVFTFDRDGLGKIYIDGQNNTIGGGYSISQFSGSDINSSDPMYFGYVFTLKGLMDEVMIYNKVLTPTEVQILYGNHLLTIADGSGSGTYPEGEIINISANEAPAGYIFDKWTGDLTYVADQTAEQTTVTVPAQNIILTATYKPIWANTGNVIYYTGPVALGRESIPTGNNLAVDGKIITKEIKVTLDSWSDFVFNKDYPLMPINQLENYINQNHHLPSIPTETEVQKEGISVGEMNAKLLQKIEELTLYLIEHNKKLNIIEKKIEKIESASK